jgi:hypothetical protein
MLIDITKQTLFIVNVLDKKYNSSPTGFDPLIGHHQEETFISLWGICEMKS